MQHNRDGVKLLGIVCGLTVFCGVSAQAGIVEVGGMVEIIDDPPADISHNQWESNDFARLWFERMATLDSPLAVNAVNTGVVFPGGVPGDIPPQEVGSIMLRTDPLGSDDVVHVGYVVFDQPILGVAFGEVRLSGSDDLLKRPDVLYNTNNQRGLEGVDELMISADRFRLDFSYSTGNFTDDVRIITAVPEPTSAALLSLATIAIVRRRRGRASM